MFDPITQTFQSFHTLSIHLCLLPHFWVTMKSVLVLATLSLSPCYSGGEVMMVISRGAGHAIPEHSQSFIYQSSPY